MKRRVVVIYNQCSSRAHEVDQQVLKHLHQLFPGGVIEYQIKQTHFEDNVTQIAKILKEGDFVVAAGGDGTAIIAANGILNTNFKHVSIGFLGFGNFNDVAGTFSRKKTIHDIIAGYQHTVDVYPLEIKVNDKHFRYAVLYTTFGLLAGAANEFEDKGKRRKLQNGGAHFLPSLFALLPYYLRTKGKNYLPASDLSDKKLTDYIAINGPRMAKVFRTNAELYRTPRFHQTTLNVARFICTSPFVIKSFFGHMPGTQKESDSFKLIKPEDIEVQTDGEYRLLKQVRRIEITKPHKHLNVVKLG